MKRNISLLCAACALLILPSCKFIRVSDELLSQMQGNPQGISIDVDVDTHGESVNPSDNVITQDEVTGEFHNLQVNIPGDVVYTPGDCFFNITGPDNVIEHMTVRNENGTLVVKSDGTRFRNLKNLKITISSPVLEDVVFNGAVDFSAPEGITALDFNATVNGAGDIDINGLKAGKVRVTVNGAGDATIYRIECDDLVLAINGAGDATLSGKAVNVDATINGVGEIDTRELDVSGNFANKIAGVGSVKRK